MENYHVSYFETKEIEKILFVFHNLLFDVMCEGKFVCLCVFRGQQFLSPIFHQTQTRPC